MVERRDVEAALQARHELGREYEPEIVEAMVDRIEKRLDERLKQRRPERPVHRGAITPLALGSIFAGVGATAIATDHNAAWLAVIVWVAIAAVLVSVAYFRR